MASFSLPAPSASRLRFKTVLWIFLGVTTLFVFITSEVLLFIDYPMYHAYRLQVIADRGLLIPHAICGTFALLAGPLQFSSRLRQRHLKLHRVAGRVYFISVIIGAFTGIALATGRPGLPGTAMQGAAWIVCTTAAVIAARNRQIAVHRQWMARSYAVTFVFVFEPGAQPCARLLEPSWRCTVGGWRHRLHPGLHRFGRPRAQLERTHHAPQSNGSAWSISRSWLPSRSELTTGP